MAASLLFLLLSLFLLAQPSVQSEAVEVLELATKAIDGGTEFIKLFNKLVDQVMPWNECKKIMDDLKEHQQEYSKEAGTLVGEIRTLLLDSYDSYHSAVRSVNRWCMTATPVLTVYYKESLSLANEPEKAKNLKAGITTILFKGGNTVKDAIGQLEKSELSFNNVSGRLLALNITFDNEFKERMNATASDYRHSVYPFLGALIGGPAVIMLAYLAFCTKYDQTKKENDDQPSDSKKDVVTLIYVGLVVLVLFFVGGILYVEFVKVPQLSKEISETQTVVEKLKAVVQKAETNIMDAKKKLSNQMEAQDLLVAKIEETKIFTENWLTIPGDFLKHLKRSTEQLIAMCKSYMLNVKSHSKLL